MDIETQLAYRAIVRGLFHSDAIDAALKDAAGATAEQGNSEAAKELLALLKGIKTDTATI